ncbi:uncharacterized protein LOC132265571 [Phlebotomus argentipes]|uniref:uncharacterized protein LOC132265571 n=1 Tax=Phlebotomus argentipes TaxID=94469 RepID=UPI0028931401|nr:uncharacterized protein LOC132265571 [Phlebotomus argentipes]
MDLPENCRKQPAKLESLDNFIKKLAEKLPENSTNGGSKLEIRRTSDLFDALQQALVTPPQMACAAPRKLLHLEIEGAEQLPKFPGRVSKKLRKKHKSHVRSVNQEPNTFVCFEAFASAESSTTKIFSTGVIEKNCNPTWQSHFSIFLPGDMDNLSLSVWRKTSSQTDAQIGTVTVNLHKNSTEQWDILDIAGQNVGKLSVKLFASTEAMDSEDSLTADLDPTLSSLIFPSSADGELGSVSFSRALKRKFTELEEISQRLKARLHDITGDASEDAEDEFERDLNTIADEEELPESENYAWLGLSDEEKQKFVHKDVTEQLFVDVAPEGQDIAMIQTALEQTAITETATDCQVYDK